MFKRIHIIFIVVIYLVIDIISYKFSYGFTQHELDEQLFYAIKSSNLKAVRRATNKGADINAKDSANFAPLRWATLSKCNHFTKFLIKKGAIINAQDKYGRTALHWSAYFNNKDCTRTLLKAKANTLIKDIYGDDVLDIAIKEGHKKIVKILKRVKTKGE